MLSSHLRRAKETAEIVSRALDMPFTTHVELSEMNNGDLSNRTEQDWRAKYAELAAMEWTAFTRMPGGETEAEFLLRVAGFWERVHLENAGKKVLVIAHGGSLHALLRHLVRFPIGDRNGLLFAHGETGIDRLRISGVSVIVDALNDTAHLV